MTLLWTMPQTRLPGDMAGIHDNTIEFDPESPDLQFIVRTPPTHYSAWAAYWASPLPIVDGGMPASPTRSLWQSGIPTKAAEDLLDRMLAEVDGLCAERD